MNPAIPRTAYDSLARTPIDRFIFATLEANHLRPSPLADRVALMRRVTLGLTGLPPTPEEIAAFVRDDSPRAYERVVDRLLASPAYGERWARHWLDVVRFGESNGYEQNHLRPNAWPYRDHVIRALNDDRPYTDFIAEQLAGDVLGGVAEFGTGFLVAGVHDTVGNQTEQGTRQQRSDDLDDIVSTIGATFLGLTVGCAKCHDHKFDPIPQRDYYSMAAVFAGVRHGERAVESRGSLADARRVLTTSRSDALTREMRAIQIHLAELDHFARAAVLRSQGFHPVPRPAVNTRLNLDDFAPTLAKFVRLVVLATKDGAEPCLDEIEIFGDGDDNLARARGAKAAASSLLPGYAIHQIAHLNDGRYGNEASWISNERGVGWAQVELPEAATVRRVVWSRDSVSDRPPYQDRLPSVYRLEVSLDGAAWRTVLTGEDRAPVYESIPQEKLPAALTPEQRQRREALARELGALRARLDSSAPTREASVGKAYLGTFTPPEPTFVLTRGDVMRRAEEVTPGALSRIPSFAGEFSTGHSERSEESRFARGEIPGLARNDTTLTNDQQRRLALARWLCDERNPLTARVLVNRLWQHHFGRGLVATPSDFGNNGAKPTHPELLDWLARDFMARGWTLKRMHKLMVMSHAYRQRTPLRRLEAESVRDAILAVSGSLDRRAGGPGFPLFQYRVVNVAIYEPLDEHPPATWRRAVYATQARAIREDLMASFDAPECAQRAPRREVTTTPLQALSLLHGNFVVQQSERFAARVQREVGPDANAQIERAFCLAFGRAPARDEQRAAQSLVAQAGLPALCRALVNANEFLYY